ncbi:MAG TPA: hypothetical protein VFU15_16485 [Bacteroidia bacterium]|nr:hypothetical protein [Bacteroidia bacterium]
METLKRSGIVAVFALFILSAMWWAAGFTPSPPQADETVNTANTSRGSSREELKPQMDLKSIKMNNRHR